MAVENGFEVLEPLNVWQLQLVSLDVTVGLFGDSTNSNTADRR